MRTPNQEAKPLQLDQVDRLRDVTRELAADRDSEKAPFTSSRTGEVANALVASLQKEPAQTLQELAQILRRARVNLREDGLRGRRAEP
jgi:hypothetical protein